MTKLERINLPSDNMRGPAQGYGTEHGDTWIAAGEKINAVIDFLNDGKLPADASSSASSTASGNAPSNAEINERLETVEIALAEIMKWMGLTEKGPVTTAENANNGMPEPQAVIGGVSSDFLASQQAPFADPDDATPPTTPPPSQVVQAGDEASGLTFDNTAAQGGGENLAQDPRNVVLDNEPHPAVGGVAPAGDGFIQLPDGTSHEIVPTDDTSGVVITGEGKSEQDAPLATFDGEPGNAVGNTTDEQEEAPGNRYVASGATGQKEAEQPVEQQGQKPGAVKGGVTDSSRDAVIGGIGAGNNGPIPGMAQLAEKERAIEAAQETEPGTDNAKLPTDDPIDEVDNPETPPSQETVDRSTATAANNSRKA